jgi:hypothetical protein
VTIGNIYPGVLPLPFVELHARGAEHGYRHAPERESSTTVSAHNPVLTAVSSVGQRIIISGINSPKPATISTVKLGKMETAKPAHWIYSPRPNNTRDTTSFRYIRACDGAIGYRTGSASRRVAENRSVDQEQRPCRGVRYRSGSVRAGRAKSGGGNENFAVYLGHRARTRIDRRCPRAELPVVRALQQR